MGSLYLLNYRGFLPTTSYFVTTSIFVFVAGEDLPEQSSLLFTLK